MTFLKLTKTLNYHKTPKIKIKKNKSNLRMPQKKKMGKHTIVKIKNY